MIANADYGKIRNIVFPEKGENDFGIIGNSSIESFITDTNDASEFIFGLLTGYSSVIIIAEENTKKILFNEDKYKCLKEFCSNRLSFRSHNKIICIGEYFADFPEKVKNDFLDMETVVVYVSGKSFSSDMVDNVFSSLNIDDNISKRSISMLNKQK
jgi:hypothetical protein